MSINKTHRRLENKPLIMIKEAHKQMVDLKSATQPISGSALTVAQFPARADVFKAGPLTIAAGATGGLGFDYSVSLSSSKHNLWIPHVTFYIDGTTYDDRYPLGGNMTSAKLKSFVSVHRDYTESNETFIRFITRIINTDAASHTYYIELQVHYPTIAGVS